MSTVYPALCWALGRNNLYPERALWSSNCDREGTDYYNEEFYVEERAFLGAHRKGKEPELAGEYGIVVKVRATPCFPSSNAAIRKVDPVYHVEIINLRTLPLCNTPFALPRNTRRGNYSHFTDEPEIN